MADRNLPDSPSLVIITSDQEDDDAESMASSASQPPPLRLYSIDIGQWDDPRAVNRRCNDCGEVGNLACFSGSFRKWALKRATKEELNQHCTHCGGVGHDCVSCYRPITYRRERLPNSPPSSSTYQRERLPNSPPPPAAPTDRVKSPRKLKKPQHCSRCGKAGHNRRTCSADI
ncbi:hypothetical protein CJ030_MR5G003229 [Morella rubra]|uniref:CCHC-type domain-containing protein n=1 Tax=Morella rubra TaxID=262757 RepID=A0A6A1VNE7_9ROSI|nr:hypothetical protein CJ030_MR5G003229 [Morella rubra]